MPRHVRAAAVVVDPVATQAVRQNSRVGRHVKSDDPMTDADGGISCTVMRCSPSMNMRRKGRRLSMRITTL